MKWTKKVPTKPGIYLRNNPCVSVVIRQDVFLIDDDLCIFHDGTVRLKNWKGAAAMWWYGPIPQPPNEAAGPKETE